MERPAADGVSRAIGASRQSWEAAVAEFARDANCSPSHTARHERSPFEVGVAGLSGVGKSSLLNALIAPIHDPIPSGGMGPLTGVPVRILFATSATLRVTYVGRAWWLDALAKLRGSAPSLSSVDMGRLSLACTGNQYVLRDPARLEAAMQYAWQPRLENAPSEAPETLAALRSVHERLCGDGAPQRWTSGSPDAEFLGRVHDHMAGQSAALCEEVELGWPSPLLATGVTIVDLPGLGTVGDAHARRTHAWVQRARAILLVTDRAGVPDAVVTCLRGEGFLRRVAEGSADLIGVMTKLDQVTDDARRADRTSLPWASTFRSIVARAEPELLAQIDAVVRREAGLAASGGARLRDAIPVFGVSSSEHQRLVHRDEESRPRLRLAESTGVPAVGRALTALCRLRSTPWASEVLDRVRAARDAVRLLPELISLVDMEGS